MCGIICTRIVVENVGGLGARMGVDNVVDGLVEGDMRRARLYVVISR